MEKVMTVIIFVPTSDAPSNPFEIMDTIAAQLGYLHCESSDRLAILKYDGLISLEHKEKLNEIIDEHDYAIMFIEVPTDYDISYSTINLINNKS